MELIANDSQRIFDKFTGKYIEIKKGVKYTHKKYTPLELERLLRLFPNLFEEVKPKEPLSEQTDGTT